MAEFKARQIVIHEPFQLAQWLEMIRQDVTPEPVAPVLPIMVIKENDEEDEHEF